MRSHILYILVTALLLLAVGGVPEARCAPSEEELLVTLRGKGDLKEKVDACRLLAQSASSQSVPVLAGFLSDPRLSHMVRYALETIPDPAVDQALRQAATTLEGRLLIGVIGSIGVRRDRDAFDIVSSKLVDPDPGVSQAAARALGRIPHRQSVFVLSEALATASPALRPHVIEGLFRSAELLSAQGRIGRAKAVYDSLLKMESLPHQVRKGALIGAIHAAKPEDAVTLLKTSLASTDYIRVSAGVQAAETMLEPAITRTLVEAMNSGIPVDHQVLIIQGLAMRKGREVVEALTAKCGAPEKPVRLAAILALPPHEDPAAVSAIQKATSDRDPEIARAARQGIKALTR